MESISSLVKAYLDTEEVLAVLVLMTFPLEISREWTEPVTDKHYQHILQDTHSSIFSTLTYKVKNTELSSPRGLKYRIEISR